MVLCDFGPKVTLIKNISGLWIFLIVNIFNLCTPSNLQTVVWQNGRHTLLSKALVVGWCLGYYGEHQNKQSEARPYDF